MRNFFYKNIMFLSVCSLFFCLSLFSTFNIGVLTKKHIHPRKTTDPNRFQLKRDRLQSISNNPNFLILFVDDLGYGDLSYNGHPTIRTPNIDMYAYAGMRFTQWYSGFHVCSPSRAAMLTGRLCVRSGCCGSWEGGVFSANAKGGLPTNETTFATILKKVGYRTKAIGKWHVGVLPKFMPLARGFDEYIGIPYSVDMGQSIWSDGNSWPPLPLVKNDTVIAQPADLSILTDVYLSEAESFIASASAANEPFVLYFPLNHVHTPDYMNVDHCNTSIRGFFGDAIQEMDELIGDVMQLLSTYDVANNTLTWFTSDNGPWLIRKLAGGSAGLFSGGKTTTWEGGVRMPSWAHWPGMIDAGMISHELTATYDIFMTMINIANATQYLPNDSRVYDGMDQSDILFFNGESQHDCIFLWGGTPNDTSCPYAMNDTEQYPACAGLWAVRCGSYKAHWVTKTVNHSVEIRDPPLLFNVEFDPSEKHPIWPNNDYYPSIMQVLIDAKWEHLQSLETGIVNQIELGSNDDNALCMDPNSQKLYPQYPNCTGSPDNWSAFVCNPVCFALDECSTKYPG